MASSFSVPIAMVSEIASTVCVMTHSSPKTGDADSFASRARAMLLSTWIRQWPPKSGTTLRAERVEWVAGKAGADSASASVTRQPTVHIRDLLKLGHRAEENGPWPRLDG